MDLNDCKMDAMNSAHDVGLNQFTIYMNTGRSKNQLT